MGCFRPIDCWPSAEPNENGRTPVVFNPMKGVQDAPMQVPCGSCDGCRADQAREWSIRMYHESQMHEQCCFLTLTYAERVIKEDVCLIAPKTLFKKDVQDFVKRLRKRFKFRYFLCGEYGGETRRPHYHAIIFGQDFCDKALFLKDGLYNSLDVERAWGHGHVAIGPATPEAISYVAGYCAKKIGDSDTFSLASTVPPIGFTWYLKHHLDVIKHGVVVFNGSEWPIPKAYFRFDAKDNLCYIGGDLDLVKSERKRKVLERNPLSYVALDNKALYNSFQRKLRSEKL